MCRYLARTYFTHIAATIPIVRKVGFYAECDGYAFHTVSLYIVGLYCGFDLASVGPLMLRDVFFDARPKARAYWINGDKVTPHHFSKDV